jgi:hypothetical protein
MKFDIRCNIVDWALQSGAGPETAVSVSLGDISLLHKYGQPEGSAQWNTMGIKIMNGEVGALTLEIAGFTKVGLSISGTICIQCELTNEAYEKWKLKIYNLIMADYKQKLEVYNAGNNKNDQLIQIKGRNPLLNREIERTEIKRHIIAILMCNYFNGFGSIMEKIDPCFYPEINFEDLEKNASYIQFFEQVFEWSCITYLFYNSMWSRKCKWSDLVDEDSGDLLFDKFLMSGAARVQVPIRHGMEEKFNWFLKTGQIWGASGKPPISGDDEYISMIQEIKESKQCDYSDRPGFIEATNGSNVLKLTESYYYWDLINNQVNSLNLNNDIDREILVDYKIYRIVKVDQINPSHNTSWKITLDRTYNGKNSKNLKHAVGALFIGAPWDIVIPAKLVYLKNKNDILPVYPLT